MRHHDKRKKFGRKRNVRNALFKSLTCSLFIRGSIKTTLAKAKAVKPVAEKLITKAKDATLSNKRLVASRIGNGEAYERLFKDIGKSFEKRNGGYVRIIKLPARLRDASPMAIIELVK